MAVDADEPKGRLVADALAGGLSVVVAHTNADLPRALHRGGPGRSGRDRRLPAAGAADRSGDARARQDHHLRPGRHAAAVVDALAAAGAGRLGRYERCAFTSTGEGTFRPVDGATRTSVGSVAARVAETRSRWCSTGPGGVRSGTRCERLTRTRSPPSTCSSCADVPDASVGLGRVGDLDAPRPLAELVERLAVGLPATARGLNVAGDLGRPVSRVAVQAGSGDDLFAQARAAGAEVYVTSDLRHHPASDALAWTAAPALIDIPHWAAEWLWLPVVQRELDRVLEDRRLPSEVSLLCTDPWTSHH